MKLLHNNLALNNSVILISILLIVALIAYPLYQDHLISVRRNSAKISLLQLAAAMEKHYAKYNSYENATINQDQKTDIGSHSTTNGGWYILEITQQTDYDYTLSAIPQDRQQNDSQCGTLSLNKSGEKSISGEGTASSCWH